MDDSIGNNIAIMARLRVFHYAALLLLLLSVSNGFLLPCTGIIIVIVIKIGFGIGIEFVEIQAFDLCNHLLFGERRVGSEG